MKCIFRPYKNTANKEVKSRFGPGSVWICVYWVVTVARDDPFPRAVNGVCVVVASTVLGSG